MKIVEINMTHRGSTGKIMLGIADMARARGHEVLTFSSCTYSSKGKEVLPELPGHRYFGTRLESGIHIAIALYLGGNGCGSVLATAKLLHQIKKFSPDIIHLHNLHAYCINLPMLFSYIKRHNIQTVWTLHDCWAFTGHCPYFDRVGCEKWRTGCFGCPQYRDYPYSRVDHSRWMYRLKRRWFTGVEKMTLVTPSRWLADLVKQSYLREYPVRVIHNGIDLQIFKPTFSDIRQRFHCEKRFLLLGVADVWGMRKGLDVFIELARRLDSRFQILLVGTDDLVDQQLPENIISIHRTENQVELAEIYTSADLFVNPTREEVLGLVNVEALACGTPVLTFRTGGSPECIDDSCGSVVTCDDIDALEFKIVELYKMRQYKKTACIERATKFDGQRKFLEYVRLYEELS